MSTTGVSINTIENELEKLANPEDAAFLQTFFRTEPGGYGEGDLFLGIRVPHLRKLSRHYQELSIVECGELLQSPYHEARLLALLILVRAYDRGDVVARDAIFTLYLDSTHRVNNWDLVDSSAPGIVGRHLLERDRSVLGRLARSASLWERRIAILSTFVFIREDEFTDTFMIADILISDRHDLIHKAVGWMLREVGKRNRRAEEDFLRPRYKRMPRTMLRYAIEKFPESLRQAYLRGEI